MSAVGGVEDRMATLFGEQAELAEELVLAAAAGHDLANTIQRGIVLTYGPLSYIDTDLRRSAVLILKTLEAHGFIDMKGALL